MTSEYQVVKFPVGTKVRTSRGSVGVVEAVYPALRNDKVDPRFNQNHYDLRFGPGATQKQAPESILTYAE